MIKVDDIIKIENEDYFVITSIHYNNIDYFFVNQIDQNDEPLNVYKIVFEDNNKINILTDSDIINILLPQFEEKITEFLKGVDDNNE